MSLVFGRNKQNKASSGEPVSLQDVWDPLEGFTFAALTSATPFTQGQLDWKETPDAHIFMADFPGVRKEEVMIEVEEEKVLKISGQRLKQSEEKSDRSHSIEPLPPNTSADGARRRSSMGCSL